MNWNKFYRPIVHAATIGIVVGAAWTQQPFLINLTSAAAITYGILGIFLLMLGSENFAELLLKKPTATYVPDFDDRLQSRVVDVICIVVLAGMGWWWSFGFWLVQTYACEVVFMGYDLYKQKLPARQG